MATYLMTYAVLYLRVPSQFKMSPAEISRMHSLKLVLRSAAVEVHLLNTVYNFKVLVLDYAVFFHLELFLGMKFNIKERKLIKTIQ